MKRNIILAAALAVGLVFSTGAPSFAAGNYGGSSKGSSGAAAGKSDVSQIKKDLKDNANLSSQEIQNIESEIRDFSLYDAKPEQFSEVAKTAQQNNCTGPCLKDTLSAMNSALSKGVSGDEAQDIVTSALRDEVKKSGPGVSGEELGSRIRAQVDSKVASRGTTSPGMESPGMGSPSAPSPGTSGGPGDTTGGGTTGGGATGGGTTGGGTTGGGTTGGGM